MQNPGLHAPCVVGKRDSPIRRINTWLKLQGLENVVMCYPIAGLCDAIAGDHVLLAPPYIFSEAQLDEVFDKLAYSLDQVVAG